MLAVFTASYQHLFWTPNSIGVPEGPLGWVWLSLQHLVSNCLELSWELQLIRAQTAPSAWCGFHYHISSPTGCNSTPLYSFCSIRRPYITFKLPRGDMDMPPRLRNFFRSLAIGMCHFRYLWNGLCDRHRAEMSCSSEVTLFRCVSLWEYNEIYFTSTNFISQFPPTRFSLITAIRMCYFFLMHHLEWHFWPGQKVKT